MDRTMILFVVATVASIAALLTGDRSPLPGLPVAIGLFTLLWPVSLALSNASIVDVFWGPGFVLLGAFYLVSAGGDAGPRGWLVTLLTAVWALRLALHIGIRNAGAGEDFRYREWREAAGNSFWWVSYFKVFLLQAVLLWIVSSPLPLAHSPAGRNGLTPADLVGLALFAFGFGFEVIADWQLTRFKRDPANRGRVLRAGLWSLSRHPNYFGEAVLWWGLGLLALPAGGWRALVGPALLTFLLVRVSGVAMLDAALVERRPGYAEYVETTPAFVPRLRPVPESDRSDR